MQDFLSKPDSLFSQIKGKDQVQGCKLGVRVTFVAENICKAVVRKQKKEEIFVVIISHTVNFPSTA